MRLLSDTRQGGKVVELTAQEWREFSKLSSAVEGLTEDQAYWKLQGLIDPHEACAVGSEISFKGVFGAVRAFYMAKFELVKLQSLLDGMKSAVESNRNQP